ncbi:MAG: hypothetical protein DBX47_07665 [Clostridiales bacterium]|nr:MAG: hypothetical protein DBX47_07665 [Clostridiales bacterium]
MHRTKLYITISLTITVSVFLQIIAFAGEDGLFKYDISESVTITSYIGTSSQVNVPDTIEGINVTAIGDFAFDKKLNITSISLPSTLQYIGECAFRACRGLTTIEIPKSVTAIGFYAFDLCENLTILCYRGSATHDYALRYNMKFTLLDAQGSDVQFEYTTTASEATLTRYIGNGGDVYIPSTLGGKPVMTIATGAFENCNTVTSINFTETVTSIEAGAFAGCENLTSFSVHENNRFFSVKDGILYNYDQTELISYAHGRQETEYTIPVPIEKIGNSAFRGSKNLRTLSFYEGVKTVGHYAFADCRNLENVYFASEPSYFGTDVFKNTSWQNNQPEGLLYFGNILCGKKGTVSGKISIKNGTSLISAYMFAETSVTSVSIPGSVRYICDRSFYNASLLTELVVNSRDITFGAEVVSSEPKIKCYFGTSVYDFFIKNGNTVLQIVPEKPRMNVLYISNNVIYITWNSIEGAQGYNVYLGNEKIAQTQNTYYTYKGLNPQSMYIPAVSAYAGETEGSKSDQSIISTVSYLSGDIDNNGDIDLSDAMKIFQHVAGKVMLANKKVGDVNSDGKVDLTDAMVVFRIVAGKILIK